MANEDAGQMLNRRDALLSPLALGLSGGLLMLLFSGTSAQSAHFTTGGENADKLGVHEVVLSGDDSVDNPFDTMATVKFVPPSGETNSKTVHAFYDGDKNWRARVYVSETGDWKWTSASAADKGLDGKTGSFQARDSKLRGRLLPHPKNPRQWMTEDGRWFLNLNDTAYFLLSPHTAIGEDVKEEDVKAYVKDADAHGITSVRCFTLIGPGGYLEDGKEFAKRWRDSVKAIRDFFVTRKIELSDFEPDHALVNDPEVQEAVRAPKLMRRGRVEFLIYHPNAAADDRNTRADEAKTPRITLDLSTASGNFEVEWYRAADGMAQPSGVIDGGKLQTLRSPWRGQDCVVRLRHFDFR